MSVCLLMLYVRMSMLYGLSDIWPSGYGEAVV